MVLGLGACQHTDDGPVSPDDDAHSTPDEEISFQQHVLPILRTNGCTGCHGGSSGLSVGTVHALMIGGDHGPAISPGEPDESLLIQKLLAPPPFGSRMPAGGPYLSDTAVGLIRRWIDEGAKDN